MVASILEISYETAYARSNEASASSLVAMEVGAIASNFQARLATARLENAFHGMNIIAWLLLSMLLLRVAYALPGAGASLRMLATTAAQIEIVGSLLFMGLMKSLNWLNMNYNMEEWLPAFVSDNYPEYNDHQRRQLEEDLLSDGLGWKTLEILRVGLRGMLFWVESVEYLFLAAIFVLIFVVVAQSTTRTFSRSWAAAGLAIAVVSMLEFTECMRAYTHGRGIWGVMLGVVNHTLLFPVWFIWLGRLFSEEKQGAPPTTAQAMTGSVWARECT